jgi:hypothetical protein
MLKFARPAPHKTPILRRTAPIQGFHDAATIYHVTAPLVRRANYSIDKIKFPITRIQAKIDVVLIYASVLSSIPLLNYDLLSIT